MQMKVFDGKRKESADFSISLLSVWMFITSQNRETGENEPTLSLMWSFNIISNEKGKLALTGNQHFYAASTYL